MNPIEQTWRELVELRCEVIESHEVKKDQALLVENINHLSVLVQLALVPDSGFSSEAIAWAKELRQFVQTFVGKMNSIKGKK
ncbi:hypothetical protein [Dongshaea marina]|uniref:hypothetical protein n=1 Tax=Dongshaea marina TaxID=2047966 RepID=UPI000D3EB012|nr:hypothetical protein [Dongshaea marina]